MLGHWRWAGAWGPLMEQEADIRPGSPWRMLGTGWSSGLFVRGGKGLVSGEDVEAEPMHDRRGRETAAVGAPPRN